MVFTYIVLGILFFLFIGSFWIASSKLIVLLVTFLFTATAVLFAIFAIVDDGLYLNYFILAASATHTSLLMFYLSMRQLKVETEWKN